jgi:hypothetical protein
MPVLGALIKQGLKLSQRVKRREQTPFKQQQKVLKKLLNASAFTAFGKEYHFSEFLSGPDFVNHFRAQVPVFNYNSMFEQWWHRCLKGEDNVSWPGRVKYFALSSGTSESSSKHIPVTRDMVKALRKASIRQMLTLSKYDLPASFFEKGILWLGGSTDLKKHAGYYEGDISGISARRVPIWFQKYYKPGKKISKEKDWNTKLEEIMLQARNWDLGIITGVPAWVQLLMEKVIAHYNLETIHDIWPNLRVYAHGGVSFEPYKKGFEKFFSHPVHYIEMYPASEGFIAFQSGPGVQAMKLILNNGIFFEFIPFDEENFDSNGEPLKNAQALGMNEVEEGKDYALLLSTCAGAWRYVIGDVIRFTSVKNAEIIIAGRTKHFLSLVGEHLSVDNMNKAVEQLSKEFNIEIPEYTVAGIVSEGAFAHKWYLGTNGAADKNLLKQKLDASLKELNDDYEVERKSALKDISVELVPVEKFYRFMSSKGKLGGQNKFPRVMKPAQLEEWEKFLNMKSER